MVLATWNVRELGRVKRSHRAIRMIARVLRSFSLVSLVELRRDTTDLRELFPRDPMTKEGFTRQIVDHVHAIAGERTRAGQLSEHLPLWAEMRVG